jgi:hypothetical protein
MTTTESLNFSYKLVVFDFDLTITCIHTFAEYPESRIEEIEKMTDYEFCNTFFGKDQTLFHKVVSVLLSKKISIAIASFGYTNVIKTILAKYFSIVGDPNYINDLEIVGRDELTQINNNDFNELERYGRIRNGKNSYLNSFNEKHSLNYSDILLIDDDKKNIDKANNINVKTYHIDNMFRQVAGIENDDFIKMGLFEQQKNHSQ